MRSINQNVIKAVPAVLLAAYFTLLLREHLELPNLVQILTGVIFVLVAFVVIKYTITKLNNNIFDKRLLFLSIGLSGLILATASHYTNPGIYAGSTTFIEVKALGDSARQNEVRIARIINNERELDLHKVPLMGGWTIKDNELVSYSGQPNTLNLAIENPRHLKIVFNRNAAGGKVQLTEESQVTVLDLYSKDGDSFSQYNSSADTAYRSNYFIKLIAGTALSFFALSFIWYISLLWCRLKNNFFVLTIPLSVIIFLLSDQFPATFIQKLLPLLVSIGSYFIMRDSHANAFISNYSKKEKAVFMLLIIYATFAFIGYRLFLLEFPISEFAAKLAFFILVGCWLTFISIAFLSFTQQCKQIAGKKRISNSGSSPVKLYFKFTSIMVLCWLVYLAGFFPANMSADSLVQWEQITGISQLNNWHPVFHTLFNKFFLEIYNNPVSVALAQILFMAGIAANWFLFLYKKGIPEKWLIRASIVFGLIPANGVYSVTLWKDIPFTFALLWLTLVIAKIVTNDRYFKNKMATIEIVAALVTAALFRHNGMPIYFLTIAALLIYFFKSRKAGILVSVAVSLGLVFWYNHYISDPARVVPNPPSVKLVAPIHGMAAVRYYGGQLSAESTQEMRKILPDSFWVNYYNPFSADEYIYFSKKPFIKDLANLPTPKAISLYANTFAHNPYLIMRDRLCGAELVWNVFEAPGAYNYKYHTNIDENMFGLKSGDNFVKKILMFVLKNSERVTDMFMWRAGVYNILVLFVLFLFLRHRKWYLLIFIPVLGSDLALLLSMTIENFRYVYFVPMIFGFLWLLYVSNFKSIIDLTSKPK
jgi:hypothetical protein